VRCSGCPAEVVLCLQGAHGVQRNSLHGTEPSVVIGRESRDARASVGKAFEQVRCCRYRCSPTASCFGI
jgi:hypothetical protein